MLLKNKVEIEQWLDKYDIDNYELISDDKYGYVVNVNEKVDLSYFNLKNIDVKFNIIKGSFNCESNQLISLIGSPEKVEGYFDCSNNKLTSLRWCPKYIKRSFYCNGNELKLSMLINLQLKKIKINNIYLDNNSELGELQNIKDFKEIKKILIIYQEKENLDIVMKNSFDIMNKEIKDKSLVKINKI